MPPENTQELTATVGEVVDYSPFAIAAGLPHDAGKTDILRAIESARASAKAGADLEASLVAEAGTKTGAEAQGVIKAWKASHGLLATTQAELTEVRKRESAMAIDALVESGKAAGKITNDALEKQVREFGASNITGAKALVDALPVAVAKVGATTTEPEPGIRITDEDRRTARQLGVSVEEMVRTRREESAQKAG